MSQAENRAADSGQSPDRPDVHWHALPAADVARRLGADLDAGLAPREAAKRLRRYGPNELQAAEGVRWYVLLGLQFRSVVVLLLVAAAAVSFALGEVLEGVGVMVVIALNAGIGFLTEYRASRAMEALRKLGTPEATAFRGGKRKTLPAADLVPGDVVVLQEGQTVPADARVIESAELRVEEASLTGEPAAVGKAEDALDDAGLPLADRVNMVYKTTHVTSGNGRAVVVATGMDTEIGRVSELVAGVEKGQTPLQRKLDRMGRRLIVVCILVAAVVFAAGFLQGMDWGVMLRAAIALAVAAVPEGLPAVATITLAVGMKRMADRNALIRRLPAVETLGSATCVCTDKTGTLTRGEMTATRLVLPDRTVDVSGGGYEPEGEFREDDAAVEPMDDLGLRAILLAGVLCNNATIERSADAWRISGDTTEGALAVAAAKAGLDADETRRRHPERHEFAFTSDAMMMGTVNERLSEAFEPGDGLMLCVKGAPDKILERCTRVLGSSGPAELDDDARAALADQNETLAGEGLRVLAVAYRPVKEPPRDAEAAYRELTWVGLFGILDPPRDEVRDKVDVLTAAGIETVMITGDQPATAGRIAAELHIAPKNGPVLTGRDLAETTPERLAEHLENVEVFARVSPEQKVDICKALQGRGNIVAMLGDGVNDAIALKQAEIGVAMGIKGTDVAKETAEMVLLDDRFATVAAALHQGRIVFANIRKFVHYLFSCNLSEIMTMLLASLLAVFAGGYVSPLPLLPLQILWLNIVTDVFPALALAMEPGESDIMRRPPRDPKADILDRPLIVSIFGFAALITVSTLAAYAVGAALHPADAHNAASSGAALSAHGGEASYAGTMCFMTIAMAQLVHVFNSRKERKALGAREWFGNRYVLGALVLVIGLQLLAVYAPFLQKVLKTRPLGARDWLVVAALALLPLAVGQLRRRFASR